MNPAPPPVPPGKKPRIKSRSRKKRKTISTWQPHSGAVVTGTDAVLDLNMRQQVWATIRAAAKQARTGVRLDEHGHAANAAQHYEQAIQHLERCLPLLPIKYSAKFSQLKALYVNRLLLIRKASSRKKDVLTGRFTNKRTSNLLVVKYIQSMHAKQVIITWNVRNASFLGLGKLTW